MRLSQQDHPTLKPKKNSSDSLLGIVTGFLMMTALIGVGGNAHASLDRCMTIFEKSDARIRRIFPSVEYQKQSEEDRVAAPESYQAGQHRKPYDWQESTEPYYVVFKIPSSYHAVSGRMIIPIEKLPPEGRIDLLQLGSEWFEILPLGNGEIALVELHHQDGKLKRGKRYHSAQPSRLIYSQELQQVNLRANGISQENQVPVAAVLDLELALLEKISGQTWRNFKRERDPEPDLIAKASAIMNETPEFDFRSKVVTYPEGVSHQVTFGVGMNRANVWLLEVPTAETTWDGLTYLHPRTGQSIRLKVLRTSDGQLQTPDGKIEFLVLTDTNTISDQSEVISLNATVQSFTQAREAYNPLRGKVVESEERRYFLIEGDFKSFSEKVGYYFEDRQLPRADAHRPFMPPPARTKKPQTGPGKRFERGMDSRSRAALESRSD